MSAVPRANLERRKCHPPRKYRWREPRSAFKHMKFAVRKRRAPLIIIVSLVDILIILLIFFVVSTTFKKDQPEGKINLPQSKTAPKSPPETDNAMGTEID